MLVTVAETPEFYLLTVYGKNEKANLSAAERNELAGIVGLLKTLLRRNQ